jgi:hypothetical protein
LQVPILFSSTLLLCLDQQFLRILELDLQLVCRR